MTDQVNVPLLRKAVEWAEAEAAKPLAEREWNQRAWLSDPAGHAMDIADQLCGPVPDTGSREYWALWDKTVDEVTQRCGTAYCIAGYVGQSLDERYASASKVDGVRVADFAADALGIPRCDTIPEGDHLFASTNTIEDVRRIAESLAGERL